MEVRSMTQITITLSDDIYERAKTVARMTGRPVSEVLSEAASASLAVPTGAEEIPIDSLADVDVVALAQARMASDQSEQLSALFALQQRRSLNNHERAELDSLMEHYHLGQLRKATALRVAVQRGILSPSFSHNNDFSNPI